jgi:hypothetical protein
MLADQLDYVIGVDPHRDVHALAIVEVRTGGVVFETSVAASKAKPRSRDSPAAPRSHHWPSRKPPIPERRAGERRSRPGLRLLRAYASGRTRRRLGLGLRCAERDRAYTPAGM